MVKIWFRDGVFWLHGELHVFRAVELEYKEGNERCNVLGLPLLGRRGKSLVLL
jgi:hypothetical protein